MELKFILLAVNYIEELNNETKRNEKYKLDHYTERKNYELTYQ